MFVVVAAKQGSFSGLPLICGYVPNLVTDILFDVCYFVFEQYIFVYQIYYLFFKRLVLFF